MNNLKLSTTGAHVMNSPSGTLYHSPETNCSRSFTLSPTRACFLQSTRAKELLHGMAEDNKKVDLNGHASLSQGTNSKPVQALRLMERGCRAKSVRTPVCLGVEHGHYPILQNASTYHKRQR